MQSFERTQIAKRQDATAMSQAQRHSTEVKAHFLAGQDGTRFLSSEFTKNKK